MREGTISSNFFFQAEDGIRDYKVTGVQTCALPICQHVGHQLVGVVAPVGAQVDDQARDPGLGGGGQGALPAVELAGGAVGKAVEGDVGQVAALGAAQQEGGEGGLGRRQGRGCGGGRGQAG